MAEIPRPARGSVRCAATTTTQFVRISWESEEVALRRCLRGASEYVKGTPLCWWHARQARAAGEGDT